MIRFAAADTPMIARLIRALADYERLSHEVVLDEDRLREHLFGPRPYAKAFVLNRPHLGGASCMTI